MVGTSGVNQLAETLNQDQQPLQAFVVGNEVTTQQAHPLPEQASAEHGGQPLWQGREPNPGPYPNAAGAVSFNINPFQQEFGQHLPLRQVGTTGPFADNNGNQQWWAA